MPKWVVKVNRSGLQRRITIPKGLLESRGWFDAEVLVLEEYATGNVELREVKSATGSKRSGEGHTSRPD